MADKSISQAVSELACQHPQMVQQHLKHCTMQFKDLTPKVSNYVYDNGQEYKMICLGGTIPMPYKGATYNIPVNIWMHQDYPNQAPIVMVTPTKDMQIKPSRLVDNNGRVYLPYLHEWKQGYDLLSLVNILCIEFSSNPPLFSRAQRAPQQQPARPAPPSYAGYNQPPASQYPSYSQAAPTIGWNLGGQQQQTRPANPNPQRPTYTQAGQPAPNTMQREDTQLVMKASIVSAVEDKLRRKYQLFNDKSESEMNVLRTHEQELQAGQEQLRDTLARIETEKAKINETNLLLQSKDKELREFLAQHERGEEEDQVDKQIVPQTPLFLQYLNLYAEESALDDAIYYLAEALRNDVIVSAVFLKNVRALSRKKFMVRALMNKVKKQAHLCEIK